MIDLREPKEFLKDSELLNIDMPEIVTKATDNIPQMLEMVQEIINTGYLSNFETSK